MKSSSGAYFVALDHVRFLAAFMLVTWHFIHEQNSHFIGIEYVPPFFPLALLDEGHTGVALFLTLSGYLFAKLLDKKSIYFPAFLWNRVLRLAPLLVVVILILGLKIWHDGGNLSSYFLLVAWGPLLPTFPNGGWTVTAELHCYILLPLLLWMLRKSSFLPFSIVILSIATRLVFHHLNGEVQNLAYNTVVGRVDQFTLGLVAYQFRSCFAHKNLLSLSILALFAAFYWCFDSMGGFFHYQNHAYPSPSLLWVFMPSIEGAAYAVGIAWYDNTFSPRSTGISGIIGTIGKYSYSIYLLHFFVAEHTSNFVSDHWMGPPNFYIACLWSLAFFMAMVPVGYLSFRFIESPFLKRRTIYLFKPVGEPKIYWGTPPEAEVQKRTAL